MGERNTEYSSKRRRWRDGSSVESKNFTGINWSTGNKAVNPTYKEAAYDVASPEEETYEDYEEAPDDQEERDIQYGPVANRFNRNTDKLLGHQEPLMLGNKTINPEKFGTINQQPETEKVTIYLDKNLVSVLKLLKKNKSINSYSQCIAKALELYLTT